VHNEFCKQAVETSAGLCTEKRDRLEEILRNITSERKSVSEAMIFCVENADKAEEIVECVAESLLIAHTPLNKKVARLYLISDILHNCCAKVTNVSYYRRG
jgi:U2-associated protein SR140